MKWLSFMSRAADSRSCIAPREVLFDKPLLVCYRDCPPIGAEIKGAMLPLQHAYKRKGPLPTEKREEDNISLAASQGW